MWQFTGELRRAPLEPLSRPVSVRSSRRLVVRNLSAVAAGALVGVGVVGMLDALRGVERPYSTLSAEVRTVPMEELLNQQRKNVAAQQRESAAWQAAMRPSSSDVIARSLVL